MDPEAILAAIAQQRDSDAEPREEQERVSYLGFYLGAEVYGLPLEQLREVARVSHLRRVPGAPAGVAGLVNLRGEILCALDVRAILGLPAPATMESPFLVALRGVGDPLGLIVDSIADIYTVSSGDIEAPPATWPAECAAYFLGTARVAAGLMGLLDLAKVTKV
ncbi:MAG: chemotaxis protein CheW [Vicinamibacterales bacterium]